MRQPLGRRREDPKRQCPSCEATVKPGARFCGGCGVQLPVVEGISSDSQRSLVTRAQAAGLLALALAAVAASIYAAVDQHLGLSQERSARHSEAVTFRARLRRDERSVDTLTAQNATLVTRLRSLSKGVAAAQGGFAPLTRRLLRSVFTIETSGELGTGWAAWTEGNFTYLITARHVVADDLSAGITTVTVRQKSHTWAGAIGKTDSVNDLAVVRVSGRIAPPLWQTPQLDVLPLAGDELILLGSPYGLEGTVTTGVVSRVSYDAIQTDAAANPGNSGGPAVNREGHVVGVLLAGGGENINFALPIQRACVTVRKC
jgi:S1-C subfamily serine protease